MLFRYTFTCYTLSIINSQCQPTHELFNANNTALNNNHEKYLPETMMVCSSPQDTQTALSSRSQNFPGMLSLNLHLPNVNTAPVSSNNKYSITTRKHNVVMPITQRLMKILTTCLFTIVLPPFHIPKSNPGRGLPSPPPPLSSRLSSSTVSPFHSLPPFPLSPLRIRSFKSS